MGGEEKELSVSFTAGRQGVMRLKLGRDALLTQTEEDHVDADDNMAAVLRGDLSVEISL
jgi:hypothetical protein